MFVHVCGLITLHFVLKTKKSISQLLGTSASRSHSVQSFGRMIPFLIPTAYPGAPKS